VCRVVSTAKFELCKINNYPWTGSSMVEQLTLNQRVAGSSPARFTTLTRINIGYL
jgi:hypothetical protein